MPRPMGGAGDGAWGSNNVIGWSARRGDKLGLLLRDGEQGDLVLDRDRALA